MNKGTFFKSTFASLLFLIAFQFQSLAGGALCLYYDASTTVNCSFYPNSGLPAEIACRGEAQAAGSPGGMNCISYDIGSCASNIFSNPPALEYCFFVGNATCQNNICNTALPAELISFEISSSDFGNLINWRTASEYNTSHFILGHLVEPDDLNTTDFSVNVSAAGTSSEEINYSVRHSNPDQKINYYILTQYDIDGTAVQYGPISIDNSERKRKLIRVVNTMGQEVDENTNGMVIEIYDDGTTVKKWRQ